jgi:hypothetical protein
MNFATSKSLLQSVSAATASIEAPTEVARVGRSGVVISEVESLESTTLIDEIVRGSQLAVEGTGMAAKGGGTEEGEEFHIIGCV